jgi:hypothetical protein
VPYVELYWSSSERSGTRASPLEGCSYVSRGRSESGVRPRRYEHPCPAAAAGLLTLKGTTHSRSQVRTPIYRRRGSTKSFRSRARWMGVVRRPRTALVSVPHPGLSERPRARTYADHPRYLRVRLELFELRANPPSSLAAEVLGKVDRDWSWIMRQHGFEVVGCETQRQKSVSDAFYASSWRTKLRSGSQLENLSSAVPIGDGRGLSRGGHLHATGNLGLGPGNSFEPSARGAWGSGTCCKRCKQQSVHMEAAWWTDQ